VSCAPGGRFLMLGLSTNLGWPGPRGYSVEELRTAFGKGYQEVFVRAAPFWATTERGHRPGWLSLFVRDVGTPMEPGR